MTKRTSCLLVIWDIKSIFLRRSLECTANTVFPPVVVMLCTLLNVRHFFLYWYNYSTYHWLVEPSSFTSYTRFPHTWNARKILHVDSFLSKKDEILQKPFLSRKVFPFHPVTDFHGSSRKLITLLLSKLIGVFLKGDYLSHSVNTEAGKQAKYFM